METAHVPSLTIEGFGFAQGGSYGRVHIEGVGKIQGSVTADERFAVSGMGTVKGDMASGSVHCEGKLKIEGRVTCGNLEIDGQMTVDGALQAADCSVNGALNVRGDCSAEQFNAEGLVSVSGLLNADAIRIGLLGPAKVKDMGGETIVVTRGKTGSWSKWLKGPLSKWAPKLEAESIEGDAIEVEYTEADAVRGDHVIIGPGCTIKRVEYRTGLIVHPSSIVGIEVKNV